MPTKGLLVLLRIRSYVFTLLVFLLLCVSVQAATQGEDASQSDQLAVQQYLYWQEINQARMNPYALLDRLGVTREQAHAALGKDAWVLYFGAPPLAWNDLLVQTAAAHGRDMIGRLYYGYNTPEGETPRDRVALAGYDPQAVNETLGLIGLGSYVEYERAVRVMIDNLLRDELTVASGAKKVLLSPDVTELGISFFAETLDAVEGQPDIYLLVTDAAKPKQPRNWIVGQVDAGDEVLLRNLDAGLWENVPVLPGDWFQFLLPTDGVELVLINPDGVDTELGEYFQESDGSTRYLDLRQLTVLDE